MFGRAAIVVVVSSTALAAGCGASDGSISAPTVPAVPVAVGGAPTTVEAQAGGIGEAISVAVGGIDDASAAVCDVDRKTLETAAEAFLLMNGSFPTSQAELVEAAFIREPSAGLDIAADGSIQPIAGGPCVGR